MKRAIAEAILGVVFIAGVMALFGLAAMGLDSRVPAEPVPCKCAKCEAKCCEVGK